MTVITDIESPSVGAKSQEVIASVLHGVKDLKIVRDIPQERGVPLKIIFRNIANSGPQKQQKCKLQFKQPVFADQISTTSITTAMETS